eukprot:IDg6668t1
MRVAESPVGDVYIAAMLLTNMKNCVPEHDITVLQMCTADARRHFLFHTQSLAFKCQALTVDVNASHVRLLEGSSKHGKMV